MFVPAFTGLGAPYWNADARGAIVGLSRGSTVAHIARAALESIAFQSAALLLAMSKDAAQGMAPETPPASASQGGAVGSARPVAITELRVDGGACVNDLLMQFQADLLGIPVVRPKVVETTALGAAYLAGLAVGAYRSLDELSAQWQVERRFLPTMPRERAAELMANWERAVRQATAT
jgi:glycerol kinase